MKLFLDNIKIMGMSFGKPRLFLSFEGTREDMIRLYEQVRAYWTRPAESEIFVADNEKSSRNEIILHIGEEGTFTTKGVTTSEREASLQKENEYLKEQINMLCNQKY